MACECVDENGSLRDTCLGTCKPNLQAMIKECETEYSNLHINTLRLLREFKHDLNQTQYEIAESYEDLFVRGFRLGFEMGREMHE